MFEILEKKYLSDKVVYLKFFAPQIAKKTDAGQFVIIKCSPESERIPLTIADYDRENLSVSVIFQIVGTSTLLLDQLEVGDKIEHVVGPLGKASSFENEQTVAIVGGGVGCAIAYPIAKKLHSLGKKVVSILGFRTADLIFFEHEFSQVSDMLKIVTDDGSNGNKGLVTYALEDVINSEKIDKVLAIGPLPMMNAVAKTTKKHEIPTTVSMNPIMIDGTGMCGGCRLIVNGQTKFACVDGPEFDAHQVDFENAIARNKLYSEFERHSYHANCNLLKKESKND